MLQYLSDKYGFKVPFHHENCDFCFDNIETSAARKISPYFFNTCSCQEIRCGATGKEKPSIEELEGGVYLCSDIFFTLRLLSYTAVNMMDNVLRLGLLGVICCLYHQLWRAETEREELTEGSRQREQKQPSLQPNPAGG